MTRLLFACVTAALLGGASARAEDAGAGAKTFGTFAELRADLLDAVSGATKRVWLTTDYLTDGELVSALYLAQYRKLDVQVLLGRGKANGYMSRLNYLKNQNVPVYLKPDSFKPGVSTAVLVDDRLLLVDGELDSLAKVRQFHVTTASNERRDAFYAGFTSAVNQKVPAVATPLPLVGKASGRGRIYAPPAGTQPAAASAPSTVSSGPLTSPGGSGVVRSDASQGRVDASGAYVYDRTRTPRPDGVPAKLPKTLKWGERKAPPPPAQNVTPPPAAAAAEPDPGAPALPQEGG